MILDNIIMNNIIMNIILMDNIIMNKIIIDNIIMEMKIKRKLSACEVKWTQSGELTSEGTTFKEEWSTSLAFDY